jgi:AcrR family transcriptional regulator
MDVTSQLQRQRRRGEELEAALLNAAWDELVEVGFAKLTMESVAARAKTGVAVLYRRWTGKDDLALAAIAHYGNMHPVELPDTGSLRGDMLTLLRDVNDTRQSFTVAITAAFAGLLASSGLTPSDVRDRILIRRPGYPLAGTPAEVREGILSAQPGVGLLYQRAHERGEIDLDRVPAAVLALPFDLMRHDLLMTLKPVPPERLETIVDDLFIPLVSAYRPVRA